MARPFIVCHILSSLDGKINGGFLGMPEIADVQAAYGELRNFYPCDALLFGAATMIEAYGQVGELPKVDRACPREDYFPHPGLGSYILSLDPMGTVRFSGNTLTRSGKTDAHVVEILTQQASDDYLAYLRGLGVSYLFAGDRELDCILAAEKLREKLGIRRIMLAGGGKIDQTFLEAGLIDELSLVIAPASEGNARSVAVFERFAGAVTAIPVHFRLIHVEKAGGDGIWLRYAPSNVQ